MTEQIQKKLIEEEMKENYIDYAMSVIMARALPDVHDGLKPVHRRVLYTMYQLGLLHNKPFRKSATVIGNTMAKYHPHGDAAIYDTLVRLAQNFSLRYPLVDGQGNFGSIDGLPAAASRYTEARLSPIAETMLEDIEKNTVNFVPNFDNSEKEPIVLPAKLPNLLINGTTGIAVGMATSIPPHNIAEVISAIIATIENSNITVDELMQFIKGPDFPTGAYILGYNGIKQAYRTGRGKIKIRAKTEINKNKIIITEIPYMINKSLLIESIVNLVKDKKITGISDIRDESDRKGMSLIIELKQSANPDVILNQLYKHTQLQVTFGITMLALHAAQPKIMTLKDIILCYIKHRRRIIKRRTQFDLDKSTKRAHILEGLKIALSNIDAVVKTIKSSKDVKIASELLQKNYSLSKEQANAILDMKLQRLTSLEQDKIINEHKELLNLIEELKSILASGQKILEIIKKELLELKEKYADERRTKILDIEEEIQDEALIPEQDIVITASYSGYIKQTSLDEYRLQRRGGKGMVATETKEEDVVEHLFITNSHSYLLFFTNKGRVHWLKAYQVPQASRYSKGKAIVNLLDLKDEKVSAILPVSEFNKQDYLLFATKNGLIKKTLIKLFSSPRKGGIKAINLRENDELVQVRITPGNLDIIIATKKGQAVKFNEKDARAMGRNSIGVRGIRLVKDEVIGMEIAKPSASLLTVTEFGYGKRTNMEEYRLIRRGGKGVINIRITGKNGPVVGIKTVTPEDEIMLITQKGIIIRTPVKGISAVGRNTQGVRIMRLKQGDKITTVARVITNNH